MGARRLSLWARPKDVAVVVLAIAATVALAACGSSDKNATATQDAAAATVQTAQGLKCGLANGKKATGAPLPVGAVVTASGGIDFSTATSGAQAFFDCVNDNGGINGRPIKYTVADDALNPKTAVASAAKVVDDDKAVALVGSTSMIDCAVNGPFYAKREIVALYGAGTPQQCFQASNIAPVNTGPRLGAIATGQYAVKNGAKNLALVAPKIPGLGDWIAAGFANWAKANNVKVAKTVLTPPGIKDATSLVLQLAAAKPDAVVFVLAGQDNLTFLKAAQQQNLKNRMRFYCLTPCYDRNFPKAAGSYWDGLDVNSEFQLVDANTPDNELWKAVMAKYEPGKPADSFSQGGMLAAKIFTDTMLKVKDPNSITRAVATRAIEGVRGYKTDMTCSPFTFGKGSSHVSNHASRMVKIDGSGFAQTEGCTEIRDPDLASG
jgi:branched-chain amino acid transport system substrate-binding protein